MGSSQSTAEFQGAVEVLATEPVDPGSVAFKVLLDHPQASVDLVYAALSPNEVRAMRDTHAANYAHLVLACVSALERGVDAPQQAANASRILCRLVGFAYENTGITLNERHFKRMDDGAGGLQGISPELPARLLRAVFHLLSSAYCCAQPPYWSCALVMNTSLVRDDDLNVRRADLLRLLLVAMAEPLFSPPEAAASLGFVHAALPSLPADVAQNVLRSLFGCVAEFKPNTWSLLMSGSADVSLPELAIQLLCVMLDRQTAEPSGPMWAATLAILDEFGDVVAGALSELIVDAVRAQNSVLASAHVECHREVVVLLIALLDGSAAMRESMAPLAWRLAGPLAQLAWSARKSTPAAAIGLVQLAAFALLHFSSERRFAAELNLPASDAVVVLRGAPALEPDSTIGDVVIIALHGLITDADAVLEPLNRLFVTVLLNIAPYLMTTSRASSQRLVNLFERFARPAFLLRKEDNYQFIFFVVEAINAMLELHSSSGHAALIYGLCRARNSIGVLKNLSLANASAWKRDRHGDFYPTEFWLQSWMSRLPLQSIVACVDFFAPVLDQLAAEGADEAALLAHIRPVPLVGLLPPPQPVVTHRIARSMRTLRVVRGCLWMAIFLRNRQSSHWDGSKVSLFTVR